MKIVDDLQNLRNVLPPNSNPMTQSIHQLSVHDEVKKSVVTRYPQSPLDLMDLKQDY